jgi:tetratricopeptide (TPR) repeat protein
MGSRGPRLRPNWADVSTVDLVAHLGRHCQRLRLLIVATYRPTELLLGPHPFQRVKLDLQSSGICTEHVLTFLNQGEVQAYLSLAFQDHVFPADFARLVHQATEGNPLFMADVLRQRGEAAEARHALTQALELVEQTGERLYEAELLRLTGELCLLDNAQAAEEWFRQSLSVARQQQARSLELRAAVSLAAMHQRTSERDETRALLAQALDWFTEGHDTRDLQEAHQLLKL